LVRRPSGRAALAMPLHPRLAAVVAAGHAAGALHAVCTAAALVNERDVLKDPPDMVAESDLALRLDALAEAEAARLRPDACRRWGLDPGAAREVLQARDQLLDVATRVLGPARSTGPRLPAGEVVLRSLLAGFCWAVGTLVVKRTSWPGMGLSLTFWQVVLMLPPIALGALVFDGLPTHMPSPAVLAATIYTGAIPMAIGTMIWFTLVKLLPAQVAALSSIAIPIVAIVSGIVILQEPLSALQAVAIASTAISLWLALVPGRQR
jgi:HrpA-like RNA helicase